MKDHLSKIANIYTLLLIVGYPLIMTEMYYHIQDDKIYFFICLTLLCLAALIIAAVLSFRIRKNDFGPGLADKRSGAGKQGRAEKKGKTGTLLTKAIICIRTHLTAADCFALFFLAVLIISTCCSRWTYEAFWGTMGRNQGLYLWLFYMAAYFIIAKLYVPKHWHMDLMVAVGIIVCAWGILDFFLMSPIGWSHIADDYTVYNFSSTIGNVNILTVIEAMYLLISSALYIGEDHSRLRRVYYYIAAWFAMAGMICGLSDNALISLGAAVCFLPFYAFRSRKSFLRYLGLIAGYLSAFAVIGALIQAGVETVSRPHWGYMLIVSADHPDIILAALASAIVLLILAACVTRAAQAYISGKSQGNPGTGHMPGSDHPNKHGSKRLPGQIGDAPGEPSAASQYQAAAIGFKYNQKYEQMSKCPPVLKYEQDFEQKGRSYDHIGYTSEVSSAAPQYISAEAKGTENSGSHPLKQESSESQAASLTGMESPDSCRIHVHKAPPDIPRVCRIIWGMLGIAAFLLVICIFYDANAGGHASRYGALSSLLVINDDWGTRRGFVWGLAIKYYRSFSPLNILIGAGPETYGIYSYSTDYYLMVNKYGETYDSPHNEFLQYLFTTGLLGVIGYYGWVISSAVSGIRAADEDSRRIGTACAFALLAYTLVSFVNISSPNMVIMVIICLGMASAAGRRKPDAPGNFRKR